MPDRIRSTVERLLDRASEAVCELDWAAVREYTQVILELDTENEEAKRFAAVAARRQGVQPTEAHRTPDPEAVEDRDAQGDEMAFDGPVPAWANFHATPDGRLFLLWHQQGGADDVGEGMYIKRLLPDEPGVEPIRIPLVAPLTRFYDAAERAGTNRSYTIDLLGHAPGETAMRYTQLRLESP